MDFTNHSRRGPLTRSAGRSLRWRTSFRGEKSRPPPPRPKTHPYRSPDDRVSCPFSRFVTRPLSLDSTRHSWPTLGLERQPQPLGWPAQSLHVISSAPDRGSFAPYGARFASELFSADSGGCVAADSRRPGVAAGQALLLFLTVSRFGCRDGPPGANRSMSVRGHRSGLPAHPWNFHEREHNVRARLEI
jgi:hypothetical protein